MIRIAVGSEFPAGARSVTIRVVSSKPVSIDRRLNLIVIDPVLRLTSKIRQQSRR